MFSSFQAPLVGGRSAAFQQCLYKNTYTGYFDGNTTFFTTASLTATTKVIGTISASIPANTSHQVLGWFKSPYTETFKFSMTTDDKGLFWIGTNAENGNFNAGNAFITTNVSTVTGSVSLTAGQYYAFRYQVGNGPGPGGMTLSVSSSQLGSTQDLRGLSFFNPNTNSI
jgi:hypothetical protein